MATHSSILAWRIPWTEEPGRLQSMGCKESDTIEELNTHTYFKIKVTVESESFGHSVVSNCSQPHRLQPTRLPCAWDSPGKNTGVGCHFLLQRIFPNLGLNPSLQHCRQILYCLSHQGSPGETLGTTKRGGKGTVGTRREIRGCCGQRLSLEDMQRKFQAKGTTASQLSVHSNLPRLLPGYFESRQIY